MRRWSYRGQRMGCLPSVAFSFALGVALALCCSYGTILFILSLFLICMVIYCCFR